MARKSFFGASETPSTKPQPPEKCRNRNTKNQTPNTKEIPSSKLQTAARASSLELLWSLELGVWDRVLLWSLEFGIWSFLPGLLASQKLSCARPRAPVYQRLANETGFV